LCGTNPPMGHETLLAELETVLRDLSISLELRNLDDEEFRITSGYCEVKSERKLIIDKSYPVELRIKIILAFLRERDLNGIYIQPLIREIIESGEA